MKHENATRAGRLKLEALAWCEFWDMKRELRPLKRNSEFQTLDKVMRVAGDDRSAPPAKLSGEREREEWWFCRAMRC